MKPIKRTRVAFYLAFGIAILQSCTQHLFVSDNRFVKKQEGYLLFFEKHATKDTGIIEDAYIDRLNDSNDVRSLFFRKKIDTSLSIAQIIEEIRTSNVAIELGEFCDRTELLQNLADTLSVSPSGIFYFIPATVSYINNKAGAFRNINLNLNGNSLKLNLSESSALLVNVVPFFSQRQYERVKEKSIKKEKLIPPY